MHLQLGGPGSSIPGDNPPCNTLFIGNLHEGVNEAELSAVFAASPGFRQLKVVRGRNTTAFVEYDSTESAMRAHDTHQNALLVSNIDKGGIRVQYSRNPYGKKRDITGKCSWVPSPSLHMLLLSVSSSPFLMDPSGSLLEQMLGWS
ncbi:hypothetical protein DUNSADRAFT_14924, partial [Dunaliella salina]